MCGTWRIGVWCWMLGSWCGRCGRCWRARAWRMAVMRACRNFWEVIETSREPETNIRVRRRGPWEGGGGPAGVARRKRICGICGRLRRVVGRESDGIRSAGWRGVAAVGSWKRANRDCVGNWRQCVAALDCRELRVLGRGNIDGGASEGGGVAGGSRGARKCGDGECDRECGCGGGRRRDCEFGRSGGTRRGSWRVRTRGPECSDGWRVQLGRIFALGDWCECVAVRTYRSAQRGRGGRGGGEESAR